MAVGQARDMAPAWTEAVMLLSLACATQEEGTKRGPGRPSVEALPSLDNSLRSPQETPIFHRGEVNRSFTITCYRPLLSHSTVGFSRPAFIISRFLRVVHRQGPSGRMWTAL